MKITLILAVALIATLFLCLLCMSIQNVDRSERRGATKCRRSRFALWAGNLMAGIIGALVAPRWISSYRNGGTQCFANIAEGQHLSGNITKYADGALAARFLLVKPGSDSNHVVVSTSADSPYGVCTDEATAAEDRVNIALLSCVRGTLKGVNSGAGALAFNDLLVADDNGKIKKLPVGAGNYYIVGICLQATNTADEVFEFAPIGAWKTQ